MTVDRPKRSRWLRQLLTSPRNLSMATWLAVAVLLVTISSLVVTSILSLTYGQDLASGLADSQLAARATTKAEEVTRYLAAMQRQAAVIAASSGTVDAVERFSDAYGEVASAAAPTMDESAELVAGFYRDEFAPALEDSLGIAVGWRSLLPTSDVALHLQRNYVVGIDDETRGLGDDAGDGSSWSEVHRELHLSLREVSARVGAADLYLVEPESGNIVYSAAKKPDFATSLDVGPYGGSTLAAAMRAVREAPERGSVAIVDMAPYVPDLGSPMVFMAAPVFDGDRMTGILILKIAGEPLDAILTSDRNWRDEGFGDSGETFLVGADGRMRSVARPFVEDPDGLLEQLARAGTASPSEQSAIQGVGSTAIFLKAMDTRDLASAAASSGETAERTNYQLRPVLSSVDSIEVGDFTWFVVAEIEQEEVAGPIGDFRRALLVAVAVFVIGITFATVSWARSVFRPIRSISERLRQASNNDPVHDESTAGAPRDFTDLADNIDEMLDSLRRREADLVAASEERLSTVRRLLPPAIAERVESGDRDVIDQIPQAGIVVVITEGLGDLVQGHDIAGAQELLGELVSEVDAAAVHHGLERVKLIGDAYYAGCGLTQPYLDHVPRSVAFALDVQNVVEELSSRHGTPLATATGIHSGPVTVGLTGSMRLVYDLWGGTVRIADFLARRAKAGEILVSSEVRALLPSDLAVTTHPDDSPGPPVYGIVGHQVPEDAQA